MMRAVNKIKSLKGSIQTRSFSTAPPNNPRSNNTILWLGSASVVGGVLFSAYKLETDPQVAADWKGTPGIEYLDPVRAIFK
mmetsp:Transcript_30097/g.51554  ORF Transcript_30097/g.51554 Transcript_30097/m.51554 type:complete len:81 (-) Transcript_30097:257-499(-)